MLGLLKRNIKKTILGGFILLALAFFGTGIVSENAYAQPSDPGGVTAPPPADEDPKAAEVSDDETTCSIEKLGWLLCPVIETAGRIGDKAFQFLATTFLETEPELVSNDETGTRYAWELARNLANIMFIIVFLIIIYSQVTGAGINNYGIKKMMPRLVVAALAVNVSYYICQLMVDLSNVMGYEIQNFMVETAKQISDRAAMPPAGSLLLGEDSPGVLEEIIMAILATAAIVWMLLPFVFVGVGTIVITCIIILVILLLRKAFIVLLIVASPIAFVLYLLPNTEKYFQKWLSMFWKLLMVFPVVGILMGGGQLASAIILSAGSNGTESIYSTKSGKEEKCIELPRYGEQQSSGGLGGWWSGSGVEAPATDNGDTGSVRTGPCDSNSSTPLLLGLVAAGIAVAPLLAVFSVLKGALSAAGAIGGKIAGAVDSYTRKGGDKAQDKYKNSSFGKFRNQKAEERKAAIQAGTYRGRGGRYNPRNRMAGINQALNKNAAFNTATGGFGGQRALMGEALNRKDTKEALEMLGQDDGLMRAWAQSGGDTSHAAFASLDQAQQEKFKQMVAAGHNRKSASFLAAANYLSENGKGSASDINEAIAKAAKAGATAAEQAAVRASAVVNYRKSGRADNYTALGGATDMNDAFSQINAPSLNHGMFGNDSASDTTEQAINRSAYYGHLLSDKGNVDKALRGFSQMDARTQKKIQTEIVNAARAHGATGATTIQEAKNHFGIQ